MFVCCRELSDLLLMVGQWGTYTSYPMTYLEDLPWKDKNEASLFIVR